MEETTERLPCPPAGTRSHVACVRVNFRRRSYLYVSSGRGFSTLSRGTIVATYHPDEGFWYTCEDQIKKLWCWDWDPDGSSRLLWFFGGDFCSLHRHQWSMRLPTCPPWEAVSHFCCFIPLLPLLGQREQGEVCSRCILPPPVPWTHHQPGTNPSKRPINQPERNTIKDLRNMVHLEMF